MFRRVRRVLVAVSGGPDSVALLILLRDIGKSAGFEVIASSFDHQLRADSADDLRRVRELCASLGVECFTGEGDVGTVARQQRRSIEDIAREMRYQFLGFVAGKEHADCVATGHTADDQAETVLMRVVRGSGVRGIRGMLPVSAVPGSEAQRLVRPLLVLTRADTTAVCAAAGIVPLTDPSNAELSLVRNHVRLVTLPALQALNPRIDQALLGLAESAREAFEGIEKAALEVQPSSRGEHGSIFDLAGLQRLPTEAVELVIEREAAFHRLRVETNRTRLRNAADVLRSGTGNVSFGDVVIEASVGLVRIGGRKEEAPPLPPVALNIPGLTSAGGLRIRAQTEPSAGVALPIDHERVRGVLRARSLQAGDRMVHHGVRRKCSDMLLEERIPQWQRSGTVAITDADGVLGLLLADKALGGHPRDATLFVSITGG